MVSNHVFHPIFKERVFTSEEKNDKRQKLVKECKIFIVVFSLVSSNSERGSWVQGLTSQCFSSLFYVIGSILWITN